MLKVVTTTILAIGISLGLTGCPPQNQPAVGWTFPTVAPSDGQDLHQFANSDLFVVAHSGSRLAALRIGLDTSVWWVTILPEDLSSMTETSFPGAVISGDNSAIFGDFVMEAAKGQATERISIAYLDEDGELTNRIYPIPNDPVALRTATATSDGGLVIVGAISDEFGLFDAPLIMKTSSAGQIQWFADLPEIDSNYFARRVVEGLDGSIYVTGEGSTTSGRGTLIKLGSGGDFIYRTSIDASPINRPDAIAVLPNGDIAFLSSTSGRPKVVRTNPDANVIWARDDGIPADAPRDTYEPRDIAVDALGNIYVVGIGTTSGSVLGFLPRIEQQAFILKLDPNGNRVWFRSLAVGAQFINAVTVLSDGTVATTGKAFLDTGTALNIILFDPNTGDVIN